MKKNYEVAGIYFVTGAVTILFSILYMSGYEIKLYDVEFIILMNQNTLFYTFSIILYGLRNHPDSI